MILQKLPYNGLSADRNTPPVFNDHHLFTEMIFNRYEYPEHAAGLGILTTIIGSGNCFVNRQKIKVGTKAFAVVNYGSRLSIQLPEKAVQPAFLFFHSGLASAVSQSLLLSNEQLLDGCGQNKMMDLSYLERLHLKTVFLNDHLQLLARLGDSCSSFHALKADIIIRVILEDLIKQNGMAAKLAANIQVIKMSTRIELYRRLSVCKEWIEANYFLPLTLDKMAAVAMLNSQHFLRMFRQCYGISPHQFLIQLRLNHSKRMLKETSEPVAVICNNVGFESLSSFSWLFKRRFGVSPTQFRKNEPEPDVL